VSPFRPVVVRTRRISVVLVTLAALALPVAAYRIGTRVNNNCESIHRVVQAGVRILNTPANLRRAYDAGKITMDWDWPDSTVVRVIDGDSLVAEVHRDLGFNGTATFRQKLRLNRINAKPAKTRRARRRPPR
jgi:endonuclease YncB( thermonuclease family)